MVAAPVAAAPTVAESAPDSLSASTRTGHVRVMTDDLRTLDDVLSDLRFAMVGTADGSTWKSRPLALVEHEGPVLRFLVSTESDWVAALETIGSPTSVTFSDPKANTYVSLEGSARTLDDTGLVARLYNPEAAAFFDGKDDPNARVLEVTVAYGEWWDGPGGRVGQKLGVLRAALGGDAGGKGGVDTTR